MADNVRITEPGTGTTIATDEISSVHYQFVKLAFGPLDTATIVTASVGLPVSLAAGAAAIAKAEDVAWADADVGVPAMAVRKASPANTSGTDGDYEMLQVSAGRLWVDASGVTLTVTGAGGTFPTTVADGGNVTFGSKADPKSTATDTTAVSIVSVLKQISASVQAPPSQPVTNAGVFAVQSAVSGDVAHGASNSGNPLQNGCEAIAHGANPTAVTAGQRTKAYANRAGIPFTIGGHPNIVTSRTQFTAAQTDASLVGTIATGTKVVVTGFQVTLDNASTVYPSVRIGFGATNTPTGTGVIGAHGGVPAGGGFGRGDGSGIIGIGGDGEELRCTTVGTATGNGVEIVITYYLIES
jgi:hypothetical protein